MTERPTEPPASPALGQRESDPEPTGAIEPDSQPTGTEPTSAEPTGTEPTGTEPTGTEPTGTEPIAAVPAPAAGADALPVTSELRGRVAQLRRAVAAVRARVGEHAVSGLEQSLATIDERLELGVDHVVVALAGGTGSGKSSLFNAVSGLRFADVGARRPTTSQVSACVWGQPAEPLLDWLGIARDRRIDRESELDADHEVPLRGIILLDLPDHDSIEPDHRAVVERLLPMADLLVWVVDPQKYADDALHSRYLRRLAGHEAAMLVLLNHVDTVPAGAVDELTADVERLLVQDGLDGVRVLAVSARTGDGVLGIREELAEVAARRTVAAVRASAEIHDVARALHDQLAAAEPSGLSAAASTAVDRLADAAGVEALAEAVERAALAGHQAPRVGTPNGVEVEQARQDWVATVGEGLPVGWARAVDEAVTPAPQLREAAAEALAQVRPTVGGSRARGWLLGLAGLVGLAAVGMGAVAIGEWLGDRSGAVEPLPTPSLWAAVGGLVLTGGLLVLRRALRRRAARRAAGRAVADVREALATVVRTHLEEPTAAVLDDHRTARQLADEVLEERTAQRAGPGSTV